MQGSGAEKICFPPNHFTEAGPSQMLRSNLGSVVLTLKKLGIDDLVRPSRTHTWPQPYRLRSKSFAKSVPPSHPLLRECRVGQMIHLAQNGAEPKNTHLTQNGAAFPHEGSPCSPFGTPPTRGTMVPFLEASRVRWPPSLNLASLARTCSSEPR